MTTKDEYERETGSGAGGRGSEDLLSQVDSTVIFKIIQARVAEVAQGHEGPPPKSLDSDENFKAEHTLFCRKLRFVVIYAFF